MTFLYSRYLETNFENLENFAKFYVFRVFLEIIKNGVSHVLVRTPSIVYGVFYIAIFSNMTQSQKAR